MKKVSLICLLLISLLCFSGCGSINSNADEQESIDSNTDEQESISSNTNGQEGIAKSDDKELSNNRIIVDDYEIVLEKEIYDNVNYEACCEFVVSKNNGNDKVFFEDRHSEGLNNNRFGENNRFGFLQDIGAGGIESDMSFEEKGNILYITYKLSISSDTYDGKLYLFDTKNNLEESVTNCTDFFELTNIVDSKEFVSQNSDTKIYVSDMSVKIESKMELDEQAIDLIFLYSNGEEKKISVHGKTSDEINGYFASYSDNTRLYHYKFVFSEMETVNTIKSISLNGVEYE